MAARKKTSVHPKDVSWKFGVFSELSLQEYHEILRLRGEVYVSTAQKPFHDVDGLDPEALHLCARVDGKLVGYTRILPYSAKEEAVISRIAVAAPYQKTDLAQQLLHRALDGVEILYEPRLIRVGAPEGSKTLYEHLGFRPDGTGYLEAGVPHISMLRLAES
jgi:ElaA protein